MSFSPTPEQADCIDKFKTGRPMVVNAYAGCGKTSTGVLMAKATPKFGTYIAFSKAIAEDAAKKFPRNVTASTVHSLAYRALVKEFGRDKMSGSINGGFLASKLQLKSTSLTQDLTLTPRGVGFLIAETLKRYHRSDRPEIREADMPVEGKLATLDNRVLDPLRRTVADYARALWRQMADPIGAMPLGHDGYLKLWALSNPAIPGDYIFLDEAQDTNPVVLGIVRGQRAQVCAVGDQHQQIFEWRGAVNAMTELPRELEARLSTSWRFGTEIAGYASKILELLGETVPLKGNPGRTSKLGEIAQPDAILTRTNGRLLSELMAALDAGKRPYVVGGVDEMKRWLTATEKLMACQSVEMPLEFFGFKSWQEVREASEREDGAELRRWVKTVDDYGTDGLHRALDGLPAKEAQADLVLSTGHKSKGREWGKVRLCDDFLRGVRTEKDDAEKKPMETLKVPSDAEHAAELRLLYVAATRGMEALDVPPALADKLAVLCRKKNVTPPPAFATLNAPVKAPPAFAAPHPVDWNVRERAHQVNGAKAATPAVPAPTTPTEEPPPWDVDEPAPTPVAAPTNGNGTKGKRKAVSITKDERGLLRGLLEKERDVLKPGCEMHARVTALLSKMEAQL